MATDSANYSNWILTRKLAEVETQASQSTDKIEWARMLASADSIPFENLANLNDNNMRTLGANQTVQVSDVNVAGNTVTVTGVFDNGHNANEYLVNTIFLTARYRGVEFLAASCVARGQAMRMPRSTAEQYTTFTVKAQVILATTNSVSIRIDPTTPATNDRVNRIEERVNQRLNQFVLDYNTLKTRVDTNDAKDRSQDTTLADHERRISENTRNLVREPRVAELISQARTALNQEISRVDGNATRNIQALDRRLTALDSSNGRVKQAEDLIRATDTRFSQTTQALDRRLTALDSSTGRVKQVEDSVGRTESTLTRKIEQVKVEVVEVIKPYVEFRPGPSHKDVNQITDNSNYSWYVMARELRNSPFALDTSNNQHWFTLETRRISDGVYSQLLMCLDGAFPPAYRMKNGISWTSWKGFI